MEKKFDLDIDFHVLKKKKNSSKKKNISLFLCDLDLKTFPEIDYEFDVIHNINCGNNELQEIDLSAELKRHLETLNICYNEISSFRTFDLFINLIYLNCSFNGLGSFDGIASLKKLKILKCEGSKIRDTFGSLKDLQELTELECDYNQISGSFLPLKYLKKLKDLYCDNNMIESENFDGIQHLKNLKHFSCDNNKNIKGSLVNLMHSEKLTNFYLNHNAVVSWKGLPMGVKTLESYHNPVRYFYEEKKNHDDALLYYKELSGTSKFLILSKLTEDFFFSWFSRDKNNFNKLYDYF